VICSDGSRSYFNKNTFADGHIESTPFGDFFIEGDASLTRIETVKGFWSKYDDDLQYTGRQPGLWERIGVGLGRTLLPSGDPDFVLHFSDRSTLVILGGGPSTGQLAGQATALAGFAGAAYSAGVTGVGRELLENVGDTAITEITGVPFPVSGAVGNAVRRQKELLRGVGRWEATSYNGSQVTRLQLANDIDGITAESSSIAREIRAGRIGVNILGNDMFAKAYNRHAGTLVGVNDTIAFAFRDQMYVRRSSATILSDTVHEGKHVLDHLGGFQGTLQQWERRAWFAEREYLSRLGLPMPHRSARDLLLDVWRNY
jgi:hypothetical protein